MSLNGGAAMDDLLALVGDPKVTFLLVGGETRGDIINALNSPDQSKNENRENFRAFVESIKLKFKGDQKKMEEVDRILAGSDDDGTKAVALQNLDMVKLS